MGRRGGDIPLGNVYADALHKGEVDVVQTGKPDRCTVEVKARQ